jgi:glycosyltransferase involved in cell wall biosynthesis
MIHNSKQTAHWQPGSAPVAVIMISLNEAHNIEAVLQNLKGWAQEVFLVDSYSKDETVDIALRHGAYVAQRRFRGFGDQWNFALMELPITSPWTMKLDPDERLSSKLKKNLEDAMNRSEANGFSMERRLWFMGRELPIRQNLVRVWRTDKCRFTDISVNEYPIIEGYIAHISGDIEHHDSPDLEHWLEKQNRYSTAEAIIAYHGSALADTPRIFGTSLQRRMWLKKNFYKIPFHSYLLFLYHWLWQGAYSAGWVGYAWAQLRSDIMRLKKYKRREIEITGRLPVKRHYGPGQPDKRVRQYE